MIFILMLCSIVYGTWYGTWYQYWYGMVWYGTSRYLVPLVPVPSFCYSTGTARMLIWHTLQRTNANALQYSVPGTIRDYY